LDFELAGYPIIIGFPPQKGYSGVAILSKIKPNNIVFGTGIEYGFRRKDNSGRLR
jgi:exodeoxyribonuclease-3